jgi:hypothetical protein
MIKVKLDFRYTWWQVWRRLSCGLLCHLSLVGYWCFRGACCFQHCSHYGGSKHLWSISNLLPDYMVVQQPRRQPSSVLDYFKLKLSVAWKKEANKLLEIERNIFISMSFQQILLASICTSVISSPLPLFPGENVSEVSIYRWQDIIIPSPNCCLACYTYNLLHHLIGLVCSYMWMTDAQQTHTHTHTHTVVLKFAKCDW